MFVYHSRNVLSVFNFELVFNLILFFVVCNLGLPEKLGVEFHRKVFTGAVEIHKKIRFENFLNLILVSSSYSIGGFFFFENVC